MQNVTYRSEHMHAHMMHTHVKGAMDTQTQACAHIHGHIYVHEQKQVPLHMCALSHCIGAHVYTGKHVCSWTRGQSHVQAHVPKHFYT